MYYRGGNKIMDNIAARHKQGLTANQLKIIAILAMTLDHIAWTFRPGYRTDPLTILLHVIGRLTAPIMLYFVAEGYYHTRNRTKYILRLFLFSIPSHFAYCFLFGKDFVPLRTSFFDQTSILWALALGLLALTIQNNNKLAPWQRGVLLVLCIILAFPADWSSPVVVAILYLGAYRNNFKKQMFWMMLWLTVYAFIYMLFVNPIYGVLQLFVALAIPLLKRYNGQRGTWKGMKWFFYLYYPAHMIVLGLFRILLQQ